MSYYIDEAGNDITDDGQDDAFAECLIRERAKDALIRELVAAMMPMAAYVPYMQRKAYFDVLARAKAAGFEP